jgi:hypothetical protein
VAVHVNTIHDTAAGKVDIGVYNLGGSTAQSEWRNVRFYRR